MSAITEDQNERILNLIKERMELGVERYGHGLRANDDTRQWGTKENSWCEMALEEILDGMVYMAAQIIRIQDTMRLFPDSPVSSTNDDEIVYKGKPPMPPSPPTKQSLPVSIRKLTAGVRPPFLSPEPSMAIKTASMPKSTGGSPGLLDW